MLRACAAATDEASCRYSDLTGHGSCRDASRNQSRVLVDQHHLLKGGVAHAAGNLAGSVDVNESPSAVGLVHRILVSLAQKMELEAALLQIVHGLGIMAHFVIVETDGALILLAAPNCFFFLPSVTKFCSMTRDVARTMSIMPSAIKKANPDSSECLAHATRFREESARTGAAPELDRIFIGLASAEQLLLAAAVPFER